MYVCKCETKCETLESNTDYFNMDKTNMTFYSLFIYVFCF